MVLPPVQFYGMSARDVALKSACAEREAHAAQEELRLVRCDIERPLILTEALWTLLKRRHKLDDSKGKFP